MTSDSTISNANPTAEQAADQFEVGQLVDGKYEIISLLGKGGMGAVYRVRHILLNIELALKTLDTKQLSDANTSKRFQTEAKAAFSLTHPNLVKVHDFGVLEDGRPFLVMDLVQGKTLQELIKESGRLSLDEVGSIFAQLCFGLAHAHQQQVVHRDIKPANIMIVEGADLKNEGSVKILDFGIAKIVNAERGEMQALTQTGEIFGSPYYMSPEQCAGESIDQRCDIYSPGCVLFEALTGTPPLIGSNALRTMMLHVNEAPPSLKEAALGVEFPQELEQMVAKMLAKRAVDRHADISAVARDLFKISGITQSSQDQSTATTSSITNTSSVQTAKSNQITLSFAQLAAIVLATATLSIIGTLHFTRGTSAGASLDSTEEKTEIKEGLKEFEDDLKRSGIQEHLKAKEIFQECPPITATPRHGGRVAINFPNYSIGMIKFIGFDGKPKTEDAKGEVILPASGWRVLQVNGDRNIYALTNSFIYGKVDPNIFNWVMFDGPDVRGLYSQYSPEARKAADMGIEVFFSSISNWKVVANIEVYRFKMTQSIVDSIGRTNTKSIGLYDASAPKDAWRKKSRFFKGLEAVAVSDIDVSELLEELTAAQNLRSFATVNTNLDLSDIRTISKFKKFVTLSIRSGKLPKPVAVALSKLKNVGDLRFTTDTFADKSSLEYFKKDWEIYHPAGEISGDTSFRSRQTHI